MNSSEEEALFLMGFILLDDKRKKKKTKNVDFGFLIYFTSVKDKECFQIFFVSFNLMIENIVLSNYLFNNNFTSALDEIFKFFDVYIQYTMKV